MKEGANLRILLRYVGSLYISKSDFRGKVEFSNYAFDIKNKKINVLAKNQGTKHVVLTNLQIRVLKEGRVVASLTK